MKLYISKYALSARGKVEAVECRADDNTQPGEYVSDLRPDRFGGWFYLREAFPTPGAALADAEQRRVKKIASLRKQIAKLEALTFTANA